MILLLQTAPIPFISSALKAASLLFQLSWMIGSSVSKEKLASKHVVIIGGGYAGAELASQLRKVEIPFTLIDPKDFFHHNVAAMRAAVFPEWMPKTTINYRQTFADNFVQGKVIGVDFKDKKVYLEYGDPIEYTDLVIAVGSDGPFPAKTQALSTVDANHAYQKMANEIDKSSCIVIVGGGPVGVEMAGELGDKYKAKKIILIHSHDYLILKDYGEGFQQRIRSCLDSIGVQLVMEDKVENLNDLTLNEYKQQTVSTVKGQTFVCDMVFKCTGMTPNTSLTKTLFGSTTFDESNLLKVNNFLQVEGFDDIYAIGDCVNTPEPKMAVHAENHAKLLAANFMRQLKDQTMQPYKQGFNGMAVTVGSYAGAAWINGWNLPSFAVGLLKGRTLFTSKYWDMMGQHMPT